MGHLMFLTGIKKEARRQENLGQETSYWSARTDAKQRRLEGTGKRKNHDKSQSLGRRGERPW